MRGRTRFSLLFGAALIASGAVLSACGGGGDDGNGGGGVSGFPFDNTNMMAAAGLGAEIAEFFPGLSQVNVQVLSAITQPPTLGPSAGPRPNAVIPIPLPGFCVNPGGTAGLTWDDKDNNATLSAGDAATLTFANCVQAEGGTLSGTSSYSFVGVIFDGFGGLSDNVTVDQVLNVTVTDIDVINFSGNLRFSFSLSGPGGTLDFLYGGVSRSDVVITTINGVEAYKFGCFDVLLSYSDIFLLPFDLRTRGIANVGGSIMQLGSYAFPDQPLQFQAVPFLLDPVPVTGTLTLVSFDARPSAGLPTCVAVGSPGNITTNQREIQISATGGGNVRVDLREANFTVIATQNTTWDNLFD
jgi:hypothetical protein